MCLSMDISNLEKLAAGLILTELHVYFSNFQSSKYPNLQKIASSKPDNNNNKFLNFLKDGSTITSFNVDGKYDFTGIHKSPDYHVDMLEDIMVPALKQSLFSESWGRPYSSANCDLAGGLFVKNIKHISFNDKSKWDDHDDHSKWAISNKGNIVCPGDMNHMTSQKKRGGSYFCFSHKKLWTAMRKIVIDFDECN